MFKTISIVIFCFMGAIVTPALASDKKFFFYAGKDKNGQKYTYSTTYFAPGESNEFNQFYRDITTSFNGRDVESNVIFQVDNKIKPWSAPFLDEHTQHKTAIPIIPKQKIDRVGAILATVRTAYSTVFWVVIGDYSWLQSTAMFGLQAAIHYSFTYKGWNLNILQTSYKLGANILERTSYPHLNDKQWFKNGVKYLTGFMTSNLIGVGFMGIIAWEEFINVFSGPQVYGEIAFYSVMSLFATGGWNNFLSEQKFSEYRKLSLKTIQRIYQFNGVLMALAFPLMMNGHQSGTALLGATGVTGILMMLKGNDLLQSIKNTRKKIGCWHLAYELLKESKKL